MIHHILKRIRGRFSETADSSNSTPAEPVAPPASDERKTPPVQPQTRPPDNQSQDRNRKPPSSQSENRQRRSPKPQTKPIWDISQFQVPTVEGKTRFHDLDLPVNIMHGVADLGFEYCSPIQAQTLPRALKGQDATGKAQTGTGKSAAFLITILTRLQANPPGEKRNPGTPRALVIVPTRELAMQVKKDADNLGKYVRVNVVAVFGGMDYQKQKQILAEKVVDLVVATPGRLLDFKRQGEVNLSQVEIMVIDEADQMLDMGFMPDVRQIINSTPPKAKRQTMLFGATLTPEVTRMASQWTREPFIVDIEPEQVTVDTVDQTVYLVTARERFALLYNLVTQQDLKRVMVFCNRRDQTRRLSDRLRALGINCDMLSGEVAQKKRIRTLEDFRSGRTRVLVATDVAGRGIHVDEVSHVINYNLPFDPEDYVHRIGRTGRAGASGISISFATEDESFYLPAIEKFIGEKFNCVYPEPPLLAAPPKPGSPQKPRPSSAPPEPRAQQPRRRRRRPAKPKPSPENQSKPEQTGN